MKKSNDTFFLFSIGPVQEFLAAARRTRDLFAGSYLLSHLAGQAAQVFLKGKAKLIFPNIKKGEEIKKLDTASIPNRIFGSVSNGNAEALAEQAATQVRGGFTKLAQTIANEKLFGVTTEKDPIWKTFWLEQSAKFLQIYYVTCPAAAFEDNYARLYRELDYALGQRKLLRDFEELGWLKANGQPELGQPGLKCSLVPNLSVVYPQSYESPKRYWDEHLLKPKNRHEFRKNERLSAIAITKRKCLPHLAVRENFPSTSTLAAGHYYRNLLEMWKQTAADSDLRKTIGEFASKVNTLTGIISAPQNSANYPALQKKAPDDFKTFLGIDGDWLHSESYSEERLKNEYGLENVPHEAGLAKSALDSLIQTANRHDPGCRPPGKYYAILYFDGDKMGEKLTKIVEDKKFDAARTLHTNASAALREFSTETVPRIVEGVADDVTPRLGKVIYSGGDDVLAFCALEDLFEILRELRTEFEKHLANIGADVQFHGSVGVAIAHHQMNLQQVLDAARNSEHFAKETLERDALGIALLKRSGEHSTTGCKWYINDKKYLEHEYGALQVLKEFAGMIDSGIVATGFIYNLHAEKTGLEGILQEEDVLQEIKRLLLRHSDPNKKEEVENYFTRSLAPFFNELHRPNLKNGISMSVLTQFIDLLEVAQFVGQGGRQ